MEHAVDNVPRDQCGGHDEQVRCVKAVPSGSPDVRLNRCCRLEHVSRTVRPKTSGALEPRSFYAQDYAGVPQWLSDGLTLGPEPERCVFSVTRPETRTAAPRKESQSCSHRSDCC